MSASEGFMDSVGYGLRPGNSAPPNGNKKSPKEKRRDVEIQEGSRFVFPPGGGMPDVYPED